VIITFTAEAAPASFAFGFVRGAVPNLVFGCLMSFFGIAMDPAVKTYTSESYAIGIRAWIVAATEGFGWLISGVIGPSLIPVVLSNFGVRHGVLAGRYRGGHHRGGGRVRPRNPRRDARTERHY
jgi:putative MFS transporter